MRAPLLLVALLLAGCAGSPFPLDPERAPVRNAIVVASHPLAAEAGAAILLAGGSAADAAIAVQMTLAVVEPHFSGIGGGAFILHYDAATGGIVALDGRETAPAAATRDMFLLPTGEPMPFALAAQMGFAVGVPGAVPAWREAWTRWGELPWERAFDAAIAHAEDGFVVDAHLAAVLAEPEIQQKLRAWPASARQFFVGAVCAPEPPVAPPLLGSAPCAGGAPFAAGETLRQPDLGATMRALAAVPRAIHEGPIAGAIVEAAGARGGRIVAADLADYEVEEREPVRRTLGEREIVSMPPPSSGVIVLQFLAMMEGFDAQAHGDVDTLHLTAEALRRVYADRTAFIADPAFVNVPVAGLLHPDYVAERRATIDPARAREARAGDPWRYQNGDPGTRGVEAGQGVHTTHFVVVDFDGNVVTATASIENVFGNGMVVPGHGFLLNNHMTDFDFAPGGPNEVEPGKRPRSAQSPTLVLEEGAPVMALGASGGPRIVAAVAQVAHHALWHGARVEEAVAAPRIIPLAFPTLRWDGDLDEATRDALAERGHAPQDAPAHIGNAQAALLVDGVWRGAADTRAAAGGVVSLPAPGARASRG